MPPKIDFYMFIILGIDIKINFRLKNLNEIGRKRNFRISSEKKIIVGTEKFQEEFFLK